MNQEKIGIFIADMRKSQGMSQKQLADVVGVTDKSVSKWECGKSLPEISKMEPLCRALKISVNELLSGERLPETAYSEKAEENMLNLIQESEIKVYKTNFAAMIAMIALSFVPIVFSILYGRTDYLRGVAGLTVWIDLPTLTAMTAITLLYLIGTKSVKAFGRAFGIVGGKTKYTDAEILASKIAVKMVRTSWLVTGVLVSILGYISTVLDAAYSGGRTNMTALVCLNLAVCSLGIVYGLIGYLILIPIDARLA